jgi:prolyl oligopeptidase PreP (S9A serine peptidase family)
VSTCATLAATGNIPLNGSRPLVLFGYGAYGQALQPQYEPEHVCLLQRGWVLAWAHVRGGGEMGKMWHASGRGLNKVSCALFSHAQACSASDFSRAACHTCSLSFNKTATPSV